MQKQKRISFIIVFEAEWGNYTQMNREHAVFACLQNFINNFGMIWEVSPIPFSFEGPRFATLAALKAPLHFGRPVSLRRVFGAQGRSG